MTRPIPFGYIVGGGYLICWALLLLWGLAT